MRKLKKIYINTYKLYQDTRQDCVHHKIVYRGQGLNLQHVVNHSGSLTTRATEFVRFFYYLVLFFKLKVLKMTKFLSLDETGLN